MLAIWFEAPLYVLPLIVLALGLVTRAQLARLKPLRLVPVDIVHPVLWLGIHILSVRLFYFSLFPVVLLMIGLFGLWYTLRRYTEGVRHIAGYPLFRYLSNHLFGLEMLGFYVLVVIRIVLAVK